MELMLLFKPPILAQINVAAEQVTGGQVVSMMVVLLTMVTSLAMMVVWFVRIGQTGHALPAAQRGILRVPVPLTFVAIGLSLLLIALTLLISIAGTSKTAEGQTSDPAQTAPDPATTVPDVVAPTPESRIPNPESTPTMSPARMQDALVETVVMDLFLFVVLGIVVLVARRYGRVRLSDSGFVICTPVSESALLAATTFASQSFWPDLDDTSAIPQLPGYAMFGERTVPQLAAVVPQASPYALLTGAGLTNANSPYSPPQTAESTERPELPDEPFSILTELRYAAEAFLAAYVPTTLLKVLIVQITMNIVGEEPDQHPFLEMLDSGVGFNIMALILLTAVFMAPIVEELQFRVVMLGGLAQLGRPMLALGLSSFLFAFAHGFPDSLALLPLAATLGYTYLRRRSYVTVMLVHFLFNGFNMAIALIALS